MKKILLILVLLSPLSWGGGSRTFGGLKSYEVPERHSLPAATPIFKASNLLFEALQEGNERKVQEAIDAGATLDFTGRFGKGTFLHVAAYYKNVGPSIYHMLIKAGANIEAKTDEGKTALMVAAESDNRIGVIALLAHGAKIDVKDHYHRSTLSYAASKFSPSFNPSLRSAAALIREGAALKDLSPFEQKVLLDNADELIKLIKSEGWDKRSQAIIGRAAARAKYAAGASAAAEKP